MTEVLDQYKRCRYSITCQTNDLAVVHCLRALCQFAERGLEHVQIAWGGTGEDDWRNNGNRITLRFTDPSFRDAFVTTANELLRDGLWTEIARNNNDPARRQRV